MQQSGVVLREGWHTLLNSSGWEQMFSLLERERLAWERKTVEAPGMGPLGRPSSTKGTKGSRPEPHRAQQKDSKGPSGTKSGA